MSENSAPSTKTIDLEARANAPAKQGGVRVNKGIYKAPIASIITVVRNSGHAIEKTLLSVIKHQSQHMEYIVLDGNSTDDTLEYIRKHENFIDYWISEPDKGIFDAINKSLALARGSYCLVINEGDLLLEFPLKELQDLADRNGDIGMFRVQMSNSKIHVSRIDYRTRFANTLHHQGCFYRREIGLCYNHEEYPHFADFDLNQKLFKSRKAFVEYPRVISFFSVDGASSRAENRQEYYRVVRANYGLWWEWIGRLYIAQGLCRARLLSFIRK
jgi:glycosyltransferase involved in cell wall biosynthesis